VPNPITNAAKTPPSETILVRLEARPKLDDVRSMPRGPERKQEVFDRLQETAKESQAPFVDVAEELKKSGAISDFETFYSPNMIAVTPAEGKADEVAKAFRTDGVADLYRAFDSSRIAPEDDAKLGARLLSKGGGDKTEQVEDNGPSRAEKKTNDDDDEPQRRTAAAPEKTPWDVEMMHAPEAWEDGADGRGLVYGIIDSGSDFEHPALTASYRGTGKDGKVSHDYNWADFVGDSDKPVDHATHGTHVLGSVVGVNEDAKFGVAPGARWISAAASDPTDGTELPIVKAVQWMQAPTKGDGSDPDPTKAPDVIGMSWSSGRTDQHFWQDAIDNLNAAGIEVVKSAGNENRGEITSPGHLETVHTIAAVDDHEESKLAYPDLPLKDGPDGKPLLKPDLAAPGMGIVSSVPGGKYATKNGTSMAQPHAAGAILDILSKYPQLTTEQLKDVLASSAKDLGDKGPDSTYGHGLIDIEGALEAAAKVVRDAKPEKD